MAVRSVEGRLYTQAYNSAQDLSSRNGFIFVKISISEHVLLSLKVIELGLNKVNKPILIELSLWVSILNIQVGIDDSHNLVFVSVYQIKVEYFEAAYRLLDKLGIKEHKFIFFGDLVIDDLRVPDEEIFFERFKVVEVPTGVIDVAKNSEINQEH